jgi:hypothetical protein
MHIHMVMRAAANSSAIRMVWSIYGRAASVNFYSSGFQT